MVDMDLSDLVDSFASACVIQRREPGVLSNGVWIERAPLRQTIKASVQPAGREVQLLPEGLRSDDALTVFTRERLRTAADPAGAGGDRLEWQGSLYEARRVDDWISGGRGNYFRVLFTRIREDDPPTIGGR